MIATGSPQYHRNIDRKKKRKRRYKRDSSESRSRSRSRDKNKNKNTFPSRPRIYSYDNEHDIDLNDNNNSLRMDTKIKKWKNRFPVFGSYEKVIMSAEQLINVERYCHDEDEMYIDDDTNSTLYDNDDDESWTFDLCKDVDTGDIIPMIRVIIDKTMLKQQYKCNEMVWYRCSNKELTNYCHQILHHDASCLNAEFTEHVDLKYLSSDSKRDKKELDSFQTALNNHCAAFINPNIFDNAYIIGLQILSTQYSFTGSIIIKARILKMSISDSINNNRVNITSNVENWSHIVQHIKNNKNNTNKQIEIAPFIDQIINNNYMHQKKAKLRNLYLSNDGIICNTSKINTLRLFNNNNNDESESYLYFKWNNVELDRSKLKEFAKYIGFQCLSMGDILIMFANSKKHNAKSMVVLSEKLILNQHENQKRYVIPSICWTHSNIKNQNFAKSWGLIMQYFPINGLNAFDQEMQIKQYLDNMDDNTAQIIVRIVYNHKLISDIKNKLQQYQTC